MTDEKTFMKKTIFIFVAAAIAFCSCGKIVTESANVAQKRFLDSWVGINYPDAQTTPLGAYILKDVAGPGESLGTYEDNPYLRVMCTVTDIKGNVTSTTSEALAKQLGSYDETNYYGPSVWVRKNNSLQVGVEQAMSGMKVGGSRSVLIPSWLFTRDVYSTAADYVEKVSGSSDAIYNFEVLETIKDIKKWELDSLSRFIDRGDYGITSADSLKLGFYYIQNVPPVDTTQFKSDTTIYINYTGRLLNGRVFDTTIKDTAKFYNLYSSSGNYEPQKVIYNKENHADIKLGESSVIAGFSMALYRMRKYEKLTAIFYSEYGYAGSNSNERIPAYSPLIFEIEMVEPKQ